MADIQLTRGGKEELPVYTQIYHECQSKGVFHQDLPALSHPSPQDNERMERHVQKSAIESPRLSRIRALWWRYTGGYQAAPYQPS